jgi:hypothetical protein
MSVREWIGAVLILLAIGGAFISSAIPGGVWTLTVTVVLGGLLLFSRRVLANYHPENSDDPMGTYNTTPPPDPK